MHLKPGPEREKAEREVAEPQRFMGLMEERRRRISALLRQTMSDYGKPCYDPGHGHRPGIAGRPAAARGTAPDKVAAPRECPSGAGSHRYGSQETPTRHGPHE